MLVEVLNCGVGGEVPIYGTGVAVRGDGYEIGHDIVLVVILEAVLRLVSWENTIECLDPHPTRDVLRPGHSLYVRLGPGKLVLGSVSSVVLLSMCRAFGI